MKLLRLLLLFALVAFLNLGAFGQVLTQDFEGSFPPTGWTTAKNSGNFWTQNTTATYAYGGSKSAKYGYSGSAAADSWLFTSGVTLTAGTTYTFSFYQRVRSGSYAEKLKFTVGTAASIADQTTVLLDLNGVTNTTFTERTGTFTPSSTGTYYFAFQCYSIANQWDIYIDDVSISEVPTCLTPTSLSASSITTTSASLGWTANSSETNWEIVVQTAGTGTPATTYGTGTATTSNPYSATGLTASTNYEYYVRADCNGDGSDLSSWAGPYTFTTACAAVTDFTINFDASSSLPSCTQKVGSTGSVSISTSYSNSTTRSLYMYTSGATYALPVTSNTGANTHRLKLYARTSSGTTSLKVGYMTDPNNAATFTTLQTLSVTNAFSQFITLPGSTPANGDYLAIQHTASTAIYIDDIVWEAIPSCIEPNTLTATSITASSADLGWTEAGTATTWDIELGTTGFTPTGTPTQSGVTANPYTYTGLAAQTTYDYYVRADCGGGDLSTWVGPYSFTTPCATISSFPATESFENGGSLPSCWSRSSANTGNWDFVTSDATHGSSSPNSGSYMARVNVYSITTSNNPLYLTTVPFELGSTTRQLSYYYFLGSSGYTGSGGNYPLEIEISTDGGNNWASLYQHQTSNSTFATSSSSGFNENTISLSGYENETVIIRFKAKTNYGSNTCNLAIDDVTIEDVPSCLAPTNLTATNITSSQADLGWTENGTATTWDIELGTTGFTPTGTPTQSGVTANPYTNTGLAANTTYDFYVRADCGGGDYSTWEGPYSFTTPCVAVSDFSLNFDGSSSLPSCTQKVGSTGSVSISTSYANSGSNSLYMFSSGATYVLPIIDNIEAATHRLKLYARASASTTLKVGYLTDPNDAATFVQLNALSITTSFQQFVTLPANTTPSGAYLAFQATSSSSCYIDDVIWEQIPAVAPNCSVISSPSNAATAINVTTNLSWSANIDATGYKLSIGTTTGGTDILNASDLGNVLTYDHPTDLAFNTTYYVTLTAYNGSGDATGCSETTFTTRDGCITPYSPSNGSTAVSASPTISWSSYTGATGYRISIGTTAGGTNILNNYDNGSTLSYAASGLSYATQYYVSVKAYNANGTTSAACNSYNFTTVANPNYGGGPDGNDPNQPNSGGYFFANSTPAASGALPSQPSYSWIDPVAGGHTEITAWTSGTDDDGYFTIPDIGFDFPFWSVNYRTNNAHINSNGMIGFGTASSDNSNTGATNSIPSTGFAENFIAGCWMDLDDNTDGKVYYGGDATQFVVTWWHYYDYGDANEYITFQIVLYPNGTIKINYNDTESTADDGTYTDILTDALVGIENTAGNKGIQYRNNGSGAPMFGSPLTVAFSTNNSALPVELTSFTAEAIENTNVLTWETATEENNSHFEVERSTNGAEFETIGTIEGNGTTVAVSKYNFVDETPAMLSYYRLRQVDFDGNFEYSKVVSVKRDAVTNNAVTLYPIPVRDRLTVQYTASTNEEMTITVVDITGRIVVTNAVTATQGENQFFIDFTELPAGSYFVRLQSDLNNTVRTVIKN